MRGARREVREALVTCDRAIAIDSRNAVAHYNRGVVLVALGRSVEAVASYDRAIAANPDYIEALLNRGNLLEQLGRFEDAMASANRIIASKPDHSRAWNNRSTLLKLARHADAIASYEKALAIDPGFGECYYNYGNALNEVGRVTEALGYF